MTPPARKPYFNTGALTGSLRRGVSTEDDVRRALGMPNGSGQLLLPGDPVPRDTWYYDKIVFITGRSSAFEFEQDVVMVFFKAGIFDGFLWFSDAEKPS
jgi:hypothetical protein